MKIHSQFGRVIFIALNVHIREKSQISKLTSYNKNQRKKNLNKTSKQAEVMK